MAATHRLTKGPLARLRRAAHVFVFAGVIMYVFTASTAVGASVEGGRTALKVVATNLSNPRKLFVASDGSIYVVEAGTGGRDTCLGKGANEVCVGLTGSITRIAGGTRKRVVTGLWSGANLKGEQAQGPADVVVRGGTYYILLQDGSINAKGFNYLGPDAVTAGDLISTPAGRARPAVILNFAAFEAKNNPDHGAGPGPKLGDPAIDSDPYAFTPYRGGFAVADAAGNDLLWISPKGAVSVLAVFPTQTEKLTKTVARKIGAPPTTTSISVQSVPSSVAVGPDGALYVGELTGAPFTPGTARIWKLSPGKPPTVYARGFTNISDLAFDGKNLLVLEIDSMGLLHPKASGALIRLAPNGARTVIASAGLVDPTGLAVSPGSIYISNNGLFPATGAGPHGEVVSLPASAGA
jgi:hypothetical protein